MQFFVYVCNWQGWGWRWTPRTHEILGDWMIDWWEMNWWQMPTPPVTPAPLSELLWDYDSSHLCPLRLYFSICQREVHFKAEGFDMVTEAILGWEEYGISKLQHLQTLSLRNNVFLWGIAGQDCIATGQKKYFHCDLQLVHWKHTKYISNTKYISIRWLQYWIEICKYLIWIHVFLQFR